MIRQLLITICFKTPLNTFIKCISSFCKFAFASVKMFLSVSQFRESVRKHEVKSLLGFQSFDVKAKSKPQLKVSSFVSHKHGPSLLPHISLTLSGPLICFYLRPACGLL